MKIEWAKKMAKKLEGSYEYYIDDDSKLMVRVYMPHGVNYLDFNSIKKHIPKNFKWYGIYYCNVEKKMYMFICQK